MIKTKKIVKPIEIDAHFKYRCPKCGYDHWVSFNEAKTRGFKIVCDCNTVFSPKRINKLQIIYKSRKEKSKSSSSIEKKQIAHINSELLHKCIPVLVSYGFTKQECENMLNKAYQINQSNDCGTLIKLALSSLGVDNNE